MNSHFFIVADRGNLKAYRAEEAPRGRAPRVQLVEGVSLVAVHLPANQTYTDAAGGFPQQTGAGPRQNMQGNSIGERHFEIEEKRRAAKRLAEHIKEILGREKPDGWSFAAPAEIQDAVLAALDAGMCKQLAERVDRDLVNVPANRVAHHFSRVRGAAA